MKFNRENLNKWIEDDGDRTHMLNYDLNDDSIVIDLGAYKGIWVDMILEKIYPKKPKIILVEPVMEFYEFLKEKFKDQENIKVINVGVSTNESESIKEIYLSQDGSSTNFKLGNSVNAKFVPINQILQECNIDKVDLIQVNIEGDEYSLMEYMIHNKIMDKFKNIHVQFHYGIDHDVERHKKIRKNMELLDFKMNFDYPFVWESWGKK
jgi:FkbM family methyltransferase